MSHGVVVKGHALHCMDHSFMFRVIERKNLYIRCRDLKLLEQSCCKEGWYNISTHLDCKSASGLRHEEELVHVVFD